MSASDEESTRLDGFRTAARRHATSLTLMLAAMPATAAAQSEPTGPNPIIEFLNNLVPEILPPLIVACAVMAVVAQFLTGVVSKPDTENKLKDLRNSSAISVFAAPLLAVFLDYIAPIIPMGLAEGLNLVPGV